MTSAKPRTPGSVDAKARSGLVIVAHRDRGVGARLCARMERSGRPAGLVGAPSELLAALAPALDDSSAVAGVLLDEGFATESVRDALLEAVRCVKPPWRIVHLDETQPRRIRDWIDPTIPFASLDGDEELWHVLLGRFRLRHTRLALNLHGGEWAGGDPGEAAVVRRLAGAAARLGLLPLATALRAVETAIDEGGAEALAVATERLRQVEATTDSAIDSLLRHARRTPRASSDFVEAPVPLGAQSPAKSKPSAIDAVTSIVSSPTS